MEKQGLSKKTKIRISISAGLVLLALLIIFFSLSSIDVPEEFKLSRKDAAEASEEISKILNDSVKNLALIARYEREENIIDARDLVQEEINKSDARNQAALNLATTVQKMTQAAVKIDSEAAKQKVVEASSFQITAITHILSYNSLLEKLLIEIDSRFETGLETSQLRIQELLTKLNEEARIINELNEGFTKALKEFDSIVRIQVQ